MGEAFAARPSSQLNFIPWSEQTITGWRCGRGPGRRRWCLNVEGDAVVGVTGHAGHVGGVELPGEQTGRGAEDVPQAVPGPPAVAGGVAPPGGPVSALQHVAVEVGRPPVLTRRGGEDQPQRVGASGLPGAGLLEAGGEPLGQRVPGGRADLVVRYLRYLRYLRFFGGSTYRCPATSTTLRSTEITRAAGFTWAMVRAASSPHRSPL
jgi:hypothetical protein